MLAGLFILFSSAGLQAQAVGSAQPPSFIDADYARQAVEAVGRQFSEDIWNKDSMALAGHYAADGMLGSIKGRDNLVSAWSRMIRNGTEQGIPRLLFVTNSITTDEEFIIELGKAQWADENGNVKSESKYLVVWKNEGGEWKIYRDWML